VATKIILQFSKRLRFLDEALLRLTLKNTAAACREAHHPSRRIWLIYKHLANTLLSDPLGRMYDALLIRLEKNRVPLDGNSPYTFDFGPRELAGMVGSQITDVNVIMKRCLITEQSV